MASRISSSLPSDSSSFSLCISSSLRPGGGRFCPHALRLHAQQPAVPSTHGPISFLALYLCLPLWYGCIFRSLISLTRCAPTMRPPRPALNKSGWSMRSTVRGGFSFWLCAGLTRTHFSSRKSLLQFLSSR